MTKKQQISITFLNEALKDLDPEPIGLHSYYSVLIPVIEKKDGLHLLYQVRSETMRRQPGEISFPGGRMEEGEIPLECAVRETHEELGIPMDTIHIISELNYINAYSNFTMYSFLGQIDEAAVDNANISKDEVKELFTVPLDYLIGHEPYVYSYELRPDVREDFPYKKFGIKEDYDWRTGTSVVPFYTYDDRVIWGLTARLTHDFVNLIKEKL